VSRVEDGPRRDGPVSKKPHPAVKRLLPALEGVAAIATTVAATGPADGAA